MRKILYITGTRADFGLMRRTLQTLNDDDAFELGLVATGMHLSAKYGATVDEIEASNLTLVDRVETELEPATGATMSRAIGKMVVEFTDIFEREKPDVILLLGDRGEMLAAAIAAGHLNIVIVHIHGGERSGTIDEMVRHAISKFSHVHLVATEGSRDRLVRMGEDADCVFVTGAPGLDDIRAFQPSAKTDLLEKYKIDGQRPLALLVYHPVLQEAVRSGTDVTQIVCALIEKGWSVLALEPNSDAGGDDIRSAYAAIDDDNLAVYTHLPRDDFLSFLAHADLLIGNSSAGIIEAASFGIPVINIGSRQNLRERNKNVYDVEVDQIADGLSWASSVGKFDKVNVYGDGNASARIVEAMKSELIGPNLLNKVLAY